MIITLKLTTKYIQENKKSKTRTSSPNRVKATKQERGNVKRCLHNIRMF